MSAGMANVRSEYIDGDLYFYDGSDNVICYFDGTNRKLVFPSGSVLDIDATSSIASIADGAIARSKLTEDALAQAMSVPISALRHTTGVPLTVAETAGGFNVSLSSHVYLAQAEITDNETEVSVCHAQVTLPPEYVAGGDITVRLPVSIVKTAAAVDNGSTIDLSVYKQAAGAVGSDLCATAAQTFAAVDTWYNKDFTVTPTGLVAGDVLNLEITSSVIDSEAGGGTLRLNMQPPLILLDVKG
jgi:hypothetical protein